MRALFQDAISQIEGRLASDVKTVPWTTLVNRLAQHPELSEFAGAVWRERYAGRQMAEDPALLATMFLKRELARRPKFQNNAETLQTAPEVAALRRRALWTNLHDRAAVFAPFLRVQEHSAQIDRSAL